MELLVYQSDTYSSNGGKWKAELLTPLSTNADSFASLTIDFSTKDKRWSGKLESGEVVLITDETVLKDVANYLKANTGQIHFEFGAMWELSKGYKLVDADLEKQNIEMFWQWVLGVSLYRPYTGFM